MHLVCIVLEPVCPSIIRAWCNIRHLSTGTTGRWRRRPFPKQGITRTSMH